MKVLFFFPKIETIVHTPPMPLGLLSIASYIHQNSQHVARIIDRNMSYIDIKNEILDFSPNVIGISVLSGAGLSDAEQISKVCNELGIPVIWGGPFSTSCAHLLLQKDYIDAISTGLGESTWLLLLDALQNNNSIYSVPGLSFRKDNKIITNKPSEDAAIPFSAVRCEYDLIHVPSYFATYYDDIAQRMVWVFGKKGCFGQCTFCCNKSFNHQKIIKRPYETVCDEIKELVEKYHADAIYFGDELWCSSREEMKEQCDMLSSIGVDFSWGCTMRVDILNKEDYEYMFAHGCRWIFFGVETGDPERMRKIKKGIKLDKVCSNLLDCYNAGILPTASFILGYPDETVNELKKTALLMRRLSFFATLDVYFYTPFIGSEMYEDMVKRGLLPEFKSIDDFQGGDFNSPSAALLANYSTIPFKDIKVINACAIIWNTFNRDKRVAVADRNNNKISQTKDQSIIAKLFSKIFIILSYTLKIRAEKDSVLSGTVLRSFIKKYADALYYSACFPRIRKKYGLILFGKKDL